MKFIVDELPYYHDECPLMELCCEFNSDNCPRTWDKYTVCSDDNPHECLWLKEMKEGGIE